MLTMRMLQAWVGVGVLAVCTGCTPPDTDIMATNAEGVGPWDIANPQVNGDTLSADVCLASDEVAGTVSDRVLLQLRNKGYQRIELTMYSNDGEAAAQSRKVSWTPLEGKQIGDASAAAENPCAARN